jgi:hypothetical protein
MTHASKCHCPWCDCRAPADPRQRYGVCPGCSEFRHLRADGHVRHHRDCTAPMLAMRPKPVSEAVVMCRQCVGGDHTCYPRQAQNGVQEPQGATLWAAEVLRDRQTV